MASLYVTWDRSSGIAVLVRRLTPLTTPDETWVVSDPSAVDDATLFKVEPVFGRPSPLTLLLGLDGSSVRLLQLTVELGVDWAAAALQEDAPPDGATVTGREASAIVQRALDAREHDLAELEQLAAQLGHPAPRAVAEEKVERLDRFLDGIRVSSDIEPTGEGRARPTFVYECHDALDAAAAELVLMSQAGRSLETCGHCQRPFVPHSRADEVYCQRPAPGQPLYGWTCKNLGPQKRYAEQLDSLNALYRRTYKLLDNRQRRGRISRAQLDAWREVARDLLAAAQSRRWSEARFERELNRIRPTEGE